MFRLTERKTKEFNVLLVSRVAAGIANGFVIAVSTQMFLSSFEGKTRVIGSLYTVAANIGGLCLGMLCNSLFTEDYGWQFNYFLSVPVLAVILLFSFVFVPSKQKAAPDLIPPLRCVLSATPSLSPEFYVFV